MSILEEIKSLNHPTALSVSLIFIGIVAPGLLTLYLFKPLLFQSLETMKLILLSITLTAPGLFCPYFVSVIGAQVIPRIFPETKVNFGTHLEWFALHSATNAFSFYIALLIAYIYSLSFLKFLLIMIVQIIIAVIFEMVRMIMAAKGKTIISSLLN